MIRFFAITPKGGEVRDYPIFAGARGWKVDSPFGNRNLHAHPVRGRYYIYLPGGGVQFGTLRVKAGSTKHD